jgi:hypothetical protein
MGDLPETVDVAIIGSGIGQGGTIYACAPPCDRREDRS